MCNGVYVFKWKLCWIRELGDLVIRLSATTQMNWKSINHPKPYMYVCMFIYI